MGRPPLNPDPPLSVMNEPTVGTSMLPIIAIAATITIAPSAEGILLVNLGKKYIISIVRPTRPSIVISSVPCIQVLTPSTVFLNNPSCDRKMTMANPLTKPIMTG